MVVSGDVLEIETMIPSRIVSVRDLTGPARDTIDEATAKNCGVSRHRCFTLVSKARGGDRYRQHQER